MSAPRPATHTAAVLAFGPMVHALAMSRARGDRERAADFSQEGFIALLQAFDTYRDDRGASFSTHAWNRINWHLGRRAQVARRGGLTGDWTLKSLGRIVSADAPLGHDPDAGTLLDNLASSRPWAMPVRGFDLVEVAPAHGRVRPRRPRPAPVLERWVPSRARSGVAL